MATTRAALAVIGGGPGGYAAAFEAAELGLDVVLVEAAPRLGGTCLHVGCIPSKAYLHVARVLAEAEEVAACGVRFGPAKIDRQRLVAWKGEVVDGLVSGLTELCKRRGVRRLRARARFESPSRLALEGDDEGVLEVERAIVATGSAPARPGLLAVDDARVMDSTGALELVEVPRRLLVIGGGYIGLEMATVYAALGSAVTIVERLPALLTGVDRDLVRPLERVLAERVEEILVSTEVTAVEPRDDGVHVRFGEREETFDRVLVAVGRRPVTDGLGLERTGVTLDRRGFIEVDARCRTRDPRILAIGDVAGDPMLAHKATHQGKVAAQVAAGDGAAAFDPRAVPAVVFTDPEIAWCGLTEADAKERALAVQVVRCPWGAVGRSRTIGRTEGLTKLVVDAETERVLGMGLVGPGAGELVHEGVLAIEMGATARDVALSIHAHPTLAESVGEAAESLFGTATYLLRPRRSR